MGLQLFSMAALASQSRNRKPFSPILSAISRSISNLCSDPTPPSFGIAFDIDGVLLRGETPIGGSQRALARLYNDSGSLKIPYVFLTNGGGFRESKRAMELSELLGVNISPSQHVYGDCYSKLDFDPMSRTVKVNDPRVSFYLVSVPQSTPGAAMNVVSAIREEKFLEILNSQYYSLFILQGHSPFKQQLSRYENDLVIAVGKGEPAAVMTEYGFKNVVSIDDYASCFENIDPLKSYKNWTPKQFSDENITTKGTSLKDYVQSQKVQAVFVLSDSVDWSRDIQVLCDVLRTGGLPGHQVGHQPPLYFAHDDLLYQGAFPTERFGMGAFRVALESVFNRIHTKALEYTMYGKPNPLVFKNAENLLKQLSPSLHWDESNHSHTFKRLYMIGDNPSVDICGAHKAGHPWFSILTRTGVFKEKGNHPKFPADLVVDSVEEAVDYILTKEK